METKFEQIYWELEQAWQSDSNSKGLFFQFPNVKEEKGLHFFGDILYLILFVNPIFLDTYLSWNTFSDLCQKFGVNITSDDLYAYSELWKEDDPDFDPHLANLYGVEDLLKGLYHLSQKTWDNKKIGDYL